MLMKYLLLSLIMLGACRGDYVLKCTFNGHTSGGEVYKNSRYFSNCRAVAFTKELGVFFECREPDYDMTFVKNTIQDNCVYEKAIL